LPSHFSIMEQMLMFMSIVTFTLSSTVSEIKRFLQTGNDVMLMYP